MKVQPGFKSLRAHDVHQGLQAAQIDRSSGLVGEELEATQLVGMAAALATGIKGIDFIADAVELKKIASQQYDIPTLEFPRVVELLEEADMVRRVERGTGKQIKSFYENVHEDFDRVYDSLDEIYQAQEPGEIDQALLESVDRLSMGPMPVVDLPVDKGARSRVLLVADAAEAIKVVRVDGRDVAYSPYFAYEHPEEMGAVRKMADVEQVRDAFQRARKYQGLPVDIDQEADVMTGLIGAGLMAGPHLEDPKGAVRMFAMAPYGLPPQLLTFEKPLLDKAMAIVAAVRMGQHWGGITGLRYPVAILRRLLEPDRWVARHSSTQRQYSVLQQLGVVRFDDASRKAMQLIDTADNRRAVQIAIDLIQHGEAMIAKEGKMGLLEMSDPSGNYRSPIQSMRPARKKTVASKRAIGDLIGQAMGWKPSV
jgi:hypothetical protein